MATILQRFTRALSPTVLGEIAKTAGLEPGKFTVMAGPNSDSSETLAVSR